MALMRTRGRSGRGDLRAVLAVLGFFAFLLVTTWERLEVKERGGRIEALERTLQEKRTDEALLRLELEQKTGFLAVQATAREWGMEVAEPTQRFLLASFDEPTGADAEASGPLRQATLRIRRTLEGVAIARPSAGRRAGVAGRP